MCFGGAMKNFVQQFKIFYQNWIKESVNHSVNNSTSRGGAKNEYFGNTRTSGDVCVPIARIKFPQSSQLTISLEQRR